jgi:hypothetical protein
MRSISAMMQPLFPILASIRRNTKLSRKGAVHGVGS